MAQESYIFFLKLLSLLDFGHIKLTKEDANLLLDIMMYNNQ